MKVRLLAVAPYAGAWIETNIPIWSPCTFIVAPYAGAWIETGSMGLLHTHKQLLLTRVRGLKLALFVLKTLCLLWLHLKQVRGLKHKHLSKKQRVFQSCTLRGCVDWNSHSECLHCSIFLLRPTWARGLKQYNPFILPYSVTSTSRLTLCGRFFAIVG